MKTYEQVDSYMQEVGLKYIKNTNDFLTGLAIRTNKDYTKKIATELNSRATGQNSSNSYFYQIKNEDYAGSIFVSAAFDGGVFRHIGNIIIDNPELFNGEIIDLACDCGIVTCFIAKMYPHCHITGVDINAPAVENAKKLAENLGLENVDFVCEDAYQVNFEKKANTVTSFRGLLDVCMKNTKGLPFFGERMWRENQYKEAFSDYAKVFKNNLKENGYVLCVERYTPEYGWLGWLEALFDQGINALKDKCFLMKASDLSSVKEYSVTFAQYNDSENNPVEIIDGILSQTFKTSTGYDGYMAEYALYADTQGEIKFYDVFNAEKGQIVHQFAISTAKSSKIITYDANASKKKIKYLNPKKADAVQKDIAQKLSVYNSDEFEVKEYSIKV